MRDAPSPAEQRRVAARVVGLLLVAGVLVGIAWWLLAPDVVRVRVEAGIATPPEQVGKIFIGEGVFAALALGAGVLSALFAVRLQRRTGPVVAVALASGGLLASVLAWRVGVQLGPDDAAAVAAEVGATVGTRLSLRSTGMLAIWPIAAMVVTFFVAFSSEPEAGPEV